MCFHLHRLDSGLVPRFSAKNPHHETPCKTICKRLLCYIHNRVCARFGTQQVAPNYPMACGKWRVANGRKAIMSSGIGSQLFTIRVWTEEISATESELRGKVLHVSSGETRYFRDWPRLTAFLQGVMSNTGGSRIASCFASNDGASHFGGVLLTEPPDREG